MSVQRVLDHFDQLNPKRMARTKPSTPKPKKVDVRHQTRILKQTRAQVDRLTFMIEQAVEIMKKGIETDASGHACVEAYKLLTYTKS